MLKRLILDTLFSAPQHQTRPTIAVVVGEFARCMLRSGARRVMHSMRWMPVNHDLQAVSQSLDRRERRAPNLFTDATNVIEAKNTIIVIVIVVVIIIIIVVVVIIII